MSVQIPSKEATASAGTKLTHVVNTDRYNLSDIDFQIRCKSQLDQEGVIVLPDFLRQPALHSLQTEGIKHQSQAYFTQASHNVYLSPHDDQYGHNHPRNRQVNSSKGCITTDQIPAESCLKLLYHSTDFKRFLCNVLGENALHEYADALSSINLHYASDGQELGWHFDNSSFAITLLIQKPDAGGEFEYVEHLRGNASDEWNFEGVESVLDGTRSVKSLNMNPGSLVLFRGRNSLHRVTPTIGDTTRMLAVLAYNAESGVALSESARQTFYGRL